MSKCTAFVDIDLLIGKRVTKMFYNPIKNEVVIEFQCGFEIVLDQKAIEKYSPKPTTPTYDNYRWAVGSLAEKEVL